jgi:hypothetical protein
MARRYVRDAKGRFAPKGYSGQTGGRGARLKSGKGNIREVGGQKRGERHVLRSAETKAASKRSFDAAVKSANVTLPKSLGGQGMPRNSFPAQAAARKKAQAQAERDAALRKSGLPKSGGAMRVKGGIKRDAKAGEKLKQIQQKNKKVEMSKAEFARRTGGKTRDDSMSAAIEMSRQPRGRTKAGDRRNEARLRKIQDDVRATDKAYDAAIKSGKIKPPTDSLARKVAGEPSNPAVQASKRVQAFTAAKRAVAGRKQRAQANLARTADTRNQPGSKMIRRPSQKTIKSNLKAEKALEFYKDPKKALKSVNKKRAGFRLPRGMR